MTTNILWCGGEDLDFPSGLISIDTTSGMFRSDYARCAVRGSHTSSKGTVFLQGGVISCWLSCEMYLVTLGYSSNIYIGLINSSTPSSGIWIGNDSASSTKIAVWKYDGVTKTKLAVESGNSIVSGTIHRIDMKIKNYGASAHIRVYVNHLLVISYIGDITVSGVTSLDCVCIRQIFGSTVAFSEIIVADAPTLYFSLVKHILNAGGDVDQWDGDYANIDDVTIFWDNPVVTNIPSQNEEFNMSSLPSGTFDILGLKIISVADITEDASIGKLKLGYKTQGIVVMDDGHIITNFDNYPVGNVHERYISSINPITTEASNLNPKLPISWTMDDINAIQVVLQSAI